MTTFSSVPAADKLLQLASEYEPKMHQLWNETTHKIRTANRWAKVFVAVFVLGQFYLLLRPGSMPTVAHNFATAEDLELLLNSLTPTRRPTRFLLHSATPHLEILDPLRFTEAHAHHHFVFHHGPHFAPVTLSCAGSESALTIRAPDVTIANLVIKSCTRSAIYVHLPARYTPSPAGNTTTLTNLTLVSNYADKGGAIHVARGFLVLQGVNATDNYAPAGGAIYLARGRTGVRVAPPSDPVHGVRNVFKANSASNGGAIHADKAALGLDLAHASFEDNVAYQAGGAVYSVQAASGDAVPLVVAGCNFTANQAAQMGGALACEGNHAITLGKSTLTGNAAGLRGGAIWLHSGSTGHLSVTATALTSNIAGSAAAAALKAPSGTKATSTPSPPASSSASRRRGGSTSAPTPRAPSSKNSSTASAPAADTAASLGGAIFLSGSCQAAITDGSTLARNSAGMGGGALTCVDCASVKITDALFDSNTAASGGAAYLQLLRGPATIHKTRFVGNAARWEPASSAKASAGANATAALGSSPSKGEGADKTKKAAAKSAAGRKGAAEASTKQADGKTKAGDKKATDGKKATGSGKGKKAGVESKAGVCGNGGGGALCIEATHAASVKVSSSRFVNNAAYSGGAAFLNLDACTRGNETCSTDVSSTEFANNTAQFSGGALHLTDMAGVSLNCHPKHLTGAAGTAATANVTDGKGGKAAAGKGATKKAAGKGVTKKAAKDAKAKDVKGATIKDAKAPAGKDVTKVKGKGKEAAVPKPTAPSPASAKGTKKDSKASRKEATGGAKVTKDASGSTKKAPKVAPPPAAPASSRPTPASPAKATSAKPPSGLLSAPALAPTDSAVTASPAPIQCAQQLASAQAPTTGPGAKGRCSNTFTGNTVTAGYGPHVATRVYCLEPRLLLGTTALTSALSASGHLRVANEQTFSYSVTPFDHLLQHINVSLPDVAIASAPAAAPAAAPKRTPAAPSAAPASIKVTSPLASIVKGVAHLPNVSVTGNVGTHSIVLQARAGSRVLAATPVFIDVRTCEVGEVTAGRTCRACDDPTRLRTYSFDPHATKCARCPGRATCRGWSLTPADGYWHAHPRSTRLYACPLPGACAYPTRTDALTAIHSALQPHPLVPATHTDLTRYERAQCAPGYRGPLCGSCAKGYGRLGPACKQCTGRLSSAALLLLWKLVEAAIIAGLIALRVYSSHEYVRTRPNLLRAASAPNSPSSSPSSSRASSPRARRPRSRSPRAPAATSPPGSPTARSVPASPTASLCGSDHSYSSEADDLLDARTVAPSLEDLLPRDPATNRITPASLATLRPAHLRDFALAIASDAGHSVAAVADALVLFHQLLSLLATLPVPLPTPLASLATALTPRVPLDCLLAPASLARPYARLLLSATTPALVLALLATTWWLVIRSRCPEIQRQLVLFQEAMILTTFQFASFYYPHVAATLLSTLSCHSIACPWHALAALFRRTPGLALAPPPPVLGYWAQDFATTCYSSTHLSFALTTALPLLIITAAAPPALLYSFVAHHAARGTLADPTLATRFSYLFADFTPAMAQGHALKFAALFLLSALVQGPIYYLGPLLQLSLVAAATAAGASWLVRAKPFVWKPMNGLYALPLAATALTALTAAVLGELPSGGVLGALLSVLWVPALVASGVVVVALVGLVAAVAQPLLPREKVVAAAQKLQGMIGAKVKGD